MKPYQAASREIRCADIDKLYDDIYGWQDWMADLDKRIGDARSATKDMHRWADDGGYQP